MPKCAQEGRTLELKVTFWSVVGRLLLGLAIGLAQEYAGRRQSVY